MQPDRVQIEPAGATAGKSFSSAAQWERGPMGSVRELLVRFSSHHRLSEIPIFGVRARSLSDLGRARLSQWLDDCAFSFLEPGIT